MTNDVPLKPREVLWPKRISFAAKNHTKPSYTYHGAWSVTDYSGGLEGVDMDPSGPKEATKRIPSKCSSFLRKKHLVNVYMTMERSTIF